MAVGFIGGENQGTGRKENHQPVVYIVGMFLI
jgi:hypothetical protein